MKSILSIAILAGILASAIALIVHNRTSESGVVLDQESEVATSTIFVSEQLYVPKAGEQVFFGQVIGRVEENYIPLSFTTCDGNMYSILPHSPAFEDVKIAYGPNLISSIAPNMPMFMTLSGTTSTSESSGDFFEQGQFLLVTQVVDVPTNARCD